MDVAAWLLIALTGVTLVVLVPQLARNREELGQARVEDRFSPYLRVLDITASQPSITHSQPCLLHRPEPGGIMNKPIPRSLSVSQDVNEYHAVRARRAAILARRRANAQRRLAGVVMALSAGAMLGVMAGFSVISWVWLAFPAVFLATVLGSGAYFAHRGEAADLDLVEQIRAVQDRLRQTAGGRVALAKLSDAARQSSREVGEATALSAVFASGSARDLGGEVTQSAQAKDHEADATIAQRQATADSGEESTGEGSDPGSERQERGKQDCADAGCDLPAPGRSGTEKDREETAGESQRLWTPTPVPVPTYSLKAQARHSVRAQADSDALAEAGREESAGGKVPVRPTSARLLPAAEDDAALKAARAAINLEEILARRRA